MRDLDPRGSFEPYERFERINKRIDASIVLEMIDDDEEVVNFVVRMGDRDREGSPMTARVSQLLFAVDRNLYKGAQDFAESVPDSELYSETGNEND